MFDPKPDIELLRLLRAADQPDPRAVMRISKGIVAGHNLHQALVQLAMQTVLLDEQRRACLDYCPDADDELDWSVSRLLDVALASYDDDGD